MPVDHGSSASPAIDGGVRETKPRPGAAGPAQTCGEEAPPFPGGETHETASAEQAWNVDALAEPVLRPKFRVWTYEAPGIVLGCGQGALLAAALQRSEGRLSCLRRESGGGAVLTGPWMVSASVALPVDHPWAGKVVESYRPLGELFLALLGGLGVAAKVLAPGDLARARSENAIGVADWACFGGLSPWEVVSPEGRKIVGLAQRRRRTGILLVAGTLVNPPDWRMLCDALGHPEHETALQRCTKPLAEALGREVDALRFAELLHHTLAANL
jgi:lipoate-protein ligase A